MLMRTENTIKNASIGLSGQMISCIMSFIVRTVFVSTLTKEYLGVSGLFTNILTMLSLAELGIGNAIIFSMYKPVAENNEELLKQLLNFYGKVYRTVGIVVGIAGVSLSPFLGFFIKDMPNIPHLQLIYILYLSNTVVSYFYAYKCSVLDANQKQYIGSLYKYKYMILRDVLQMLFLILTHNFIFYLLIQISVTVYSNWKISKKAETLFQWVTDSNKSAPLSSDIMKEIKKNVFAMFNHNVGAVVVNGTDNILISKFAGLVEVGLYSNYSLILSGIVAIVAKVTEAAAASVGNLGVLENEKKVFSVYCTMNLVNFWIYSFCTICFLMLFQPFIKMWLGADFLLSNGVVLIICINFYVSGMRRVNITFRDAMGLFWYDRYKPLAEAAINLIASICLAKQWGIAGVFIGTFISNMMTGFWVEPYILFKYKFGNGIKNYMLRYFMYTGCMVVAGGIVWKVSLLTSGTGWSDIAFRIICCIVIVNIFYLIAFFRTTEFQNLRNLIVPEVKRMIGRRRS